MAPTAVVPKVSKLYESFQAGKTLTNAELKALHDHMKELSDLLRISGPIFHLAANEAYRVTDRVSMIILARKER